MSVSFIKGGNQWFLFISHDKSCLFSVIHLVLGDVGVGGFKKFECSVIFDVSR